MYRVKNRREEKVSGPRSIRSETICFQGNLAKTAGRWGAHGPPRALRFRLESKPKLLLNWTCSHPMYLCLIPEAEHVIQSGDNSDRRRAQCLSRQGQHLRTPVGKGTVLLDSQRNLSQTKVLALKLHFTLLSSPSLTKTTNQPTNHATNQTHKQG